MSFWKSKQHFFVYIYAKWRGTIRPCFYKFAPRICFPRLKFGALGISPNVPAQHKYVRLQYALVELNSPTSITRLLNRVIVLTLTTNHLITKYLHWTKINIFPNSSNFLIYILCVCVFFSIPCMRSLQSRSDDTLHADRVIAPPSLLGLTDSPMCAGGGLTLIEPFNEFY